MVRQPNGLSSGVSSLLARPDGSSKVAEVMPDLKGNSDIHILFFLGDHFNEETNLVGFPEGNNAAEETKIRLRATAHDESCVCPSVCVS